MRLLYANVKISAKNNQCYFGGKDVPKHLIIIQYLDLRDPND